jgi:hypothetical protein
MDRLQAVTDDDPGRTSYWGEKGKLSARPLTRMTRSRRRLEASASRQHRDLLMSATERLLCDGLPFFGRFPLGSRSCATPSVI